MGKGPICLGHPVTIFLLLEGRTGLVVSVDNFCFKPLGIWHALARSSRLYEPRKSKMHLPMPRNWERDLIICPAHTA